MTIIKHLLHAFIYSAKGLIYAIKTQLAVRIELVILIVAIPISFLLGKTIAQQLLLFSSVFFVLIAEIINTAIEAVVDRISDEKHPLSGAAKDVGSLAVLLAIINAVVVWGYILLDWLFVG